MAKRKPLTAQQKYVLEYVANQTETANEGTDKSKSDILEIGCRSVRMWGKTVRVVEWREKWKSAVVVIESGGQIDGVVSTYNWPFHLNCVFPFINFEVLDDCGYLERFGNGEEYVIDGKRYGVKSDVVWAGGKRYLSSAERTGFGSFRDFLVKHPNHIMRKSII